MLPYSYYYNSECSDLHATQTAEFDFRNEPKPEWAGKFDGFFANAVLLHAPPDVFENALRNIAVVLKENGVAAFSLKTGEGEEITLEKMDAPRYFRYHTEAEIREILSRLPFEIISFSSSSSATSFSVPFPTSTFLSAGF